jgi:hypothetical protein
MWGRASRGMDRTGGIWQKYHVPREGRAVRVLSGSWFLSLGIWWEPRQPWLGLVAPRFLLLPRQQTAEEETEPDATPTHTHDASISNHHVDARNEEEISCFWLLRIRLGQIFLQAPPLASQIITLPLSPRSTAYAMASYRYLHLPRYHCTQPRATSSLARTTYVRSPAQALGSKTLSPCDLLCWSLQLPFPSLTR